MMTKEDNESSFNINFEEKLNNLLKKFHEEISIQSQVIITRRLH